MDSSFIIGKIKTTVGDIPQITTTLNYRDYWGAIKVRWGIKRESFRVEPGLYAIGNPNENSDVLVTGNYKLTFDTVRKNLVEMNLWLLVLDTKGVNVWCAAGKGTFGTKELVNRIRLTSLDTIVSHRRIILPQLGATGVSAHEVKELTSSANSQNLTQTTSFSAGTFKNLGAGLKANPGFNVTYGPVRAEDIKKFIEGGYKASAEMRRVKFEFTDRAKLIPNDFMYGKKYLSIAFLVLFVISTFGKWSIPFENILRIGLTSVFNLFVAYLAGIVLTPLLLPYIPMKRFAIKGFLVSLATSTVLLAINNLGTGIFEIASWYLISGAVASFMAMNFTGSSTYTSLSGVKVEMKVAVPFQISFAAVGLIFLILGKIL